MKTHFYILLMLGMVFLLGCEDEKLGTDLGVTNVVLPDISEESLGTEITIQGNGFIDCDVLALSPLSGGTEQPIYMETREVIFLSLIFSVPSVKVTYLALEDIFSPLNISGKRADKALRRFSSGITPTVLLMTPNVRILLPRTNTSP